MLSFNPPLDETTILNIPFHPGHLNLTATLANEQLGPRSIVQIWTDIPNNSIDRGQQDWSARSFQFQKNASVAILSIPFQDLIHPSRSHFSFTYRILHPDGRIHWLGEFGKNGSFIVNRYDDRLVLFGDWAANPLGHTFAPKSTIKTPLQVFSLSDKIQWRCWDLSNSAPRLLSVNDGPSCIHSALLIPSQSKSAIISLAPILLTSQDIRVTIHSSARSVYITSLSRAGLLSLQTLSPDALISSITNLLPSSISIPDPDNRHAILLANPDRTPARLFLIPLSADSSASAPSTLSLPLSQLRSHVNFLSDGSSSHFSISKPTRFIPTSADHVHLATLDFGGAQFSLSPVYDLLKPNGDVRVSLFAKHDRIATPPNNLPTPPPSPPFKATEIDPQPFNSPGNGQLSDQVPTVHIHPVDDKTSQPIEVVPASGQSTPNLGIKDQLASGQSTPKPRTATSTKPGASTPAITRPIQRGIIRKLIHFVLRILVFYARILSRIIFVVLYRLFSFCVQKKPSVATPKVSSIESSDDQTGIRSASLSSAVHTPTLLTPRRQHSGASTPRNDAVNSVGQKVPGIAETLEAVSTIIVPEYSAKAGEEEKLQGDLGGSYVQELNPETDTENGKSGHNGEWEVVHRPGVLIELSALPSSPTQTEGEAPKELKPIRLTLCGDEDLVKEVGFHLDDIEVTDVKVAPLAGAGQAGLWSAEIPRATKDLTTLRVS